MKNSAFSKDNLKILIPSITPQQIAQLEKFATLLREWNQRHNLISRKDSDHIWENHILPSLIPLALIELPEAYWLLDVGSGGGFPAIPIKIVRPDLQMMLIDSVRKKTLFLQKIVLDLQLENVVVKRERIESLNDPTFMEKFDVVTARAVADISALVEWSRPFLKREGSLLLWKGLSDTEELEEIAQGLMLKYEVISVPYKFQSLSGKFEELCLLKIRF